MQRIAYPNGIYFFTRLLRSSETTAPKTATKPSIAAATKSGDGSAVTLAFRTSDTGITAKTEKISRVVFLCIYLTILFGIALWLKDLLSRFLD
jgi:hypothetical protein